MINNNRYQRRLSIIVEYLILRLKRREYFLFNKINTSTNRAIMSTISANIVLTKNKLLTF
jgi:hypothetical protein